MDFSLVIPALNELQKIKHDVENAASFICEARLRGKIIVVEDGITDNTAEAARSAKIPSSVRRVVIRLDKNSGKGLAVKTGIKETKGDVV
ncbi:MAG: glycosyltransferase [Candidatus Aminicenantes bacterium]|nr:glycosyltransferase [Candidatus Aminicenantes bacterium]